MILYPTPENLEIAAKALREFKVVGFPTETVYGLAAVATSQEACSLVFETKQRPPTDPLIVHVNTLEQLKTVAVISDYQYKALTALADKFWPGPMTIVLQKRDNIPLVCTAGQETVGIRIPSHPVARKMIEMSGPLAAPSANKFGHVSPVRAQHVADDFGEDLIVIDGDSCTVGIESTVLMIKEDSVYIFRRGIITEQMISQCLYEKNIDLKVVSRYVSHSGVQVSPGCLQTHYAIGDVVSMVLCKYAPKYENVQPISIDGDKITGIVNCSLDETNIDGLVKRLNLTQKPKIMMIQDAPLYKYFEALRFLEHQQIQYLLVIPPLSVYNSGQAEGVDASLFDRVFRSCSGRYCIVE